MGVIRANTDDIGSLNNEIKNANNAYETFCVDLEKMINDIVETNPGTIADFFKDAYDNKVKPVLKSNAESFETGHRFLESTKEELAETIDTVAKIAGN